MYFGVAPNRLIYSVAKTNQHNRYPGTFLYICAKCQ